MRPHGRARVSPRNPRAFARCDRCGFLYNHINLNWQFDWRGTSLQNLRFLVCNRCMDTPQQQLRAIVVPADPTPIMNARVESYQEDETDFLTISGPTVYDPNTGIPIPSTTVLIAQDGTKLTAQATGRPAGLQQGAIMPLVQKTAYGVRLPVLSVTANGTNTVSVTCSSVHSLNDNDQISVLGLTNNLADGFFSVKVTTATAFSYDTYSVIASGSLLTGTSNIVTAIVGVPYDYAKIPQVGP